MKTFRDIEWTTHPVGEGIRGTVELLNGNTLSIVAGPHMYCSPKMDGSTHTDYSAFEVAIFDKDDEFVCEPLGWQTRGDINILIRKQV